MSEKIFNVLFLCTGNSARSVMAEALVTILGHGRFKGYSAGSNPTGTINPLALEQIRSFRPDYPFDNLYSKRWDEFATADAPEMDLIITVCDNAAGEVCPIWPGRPATAHWGFEDPAAVEGTIDIRRAAFEKVFLQIFQSVSSLTELFLDRMDPIDVQQHIREIGKNSH